MLSSKPSIGTRPAIQQAPPPSVVKKPLSKEIEIFGRKLEGEEISRLFFSLKKEVEAVDPRYIRAMVIGAKHSGKTRSAIYTLPRPICLFAFDPDSERMVKQEWLETGEVVVVRFYGDDPSAPSAYRRYEQIAREWKTNGVFNYFASLVIDSFTTLQNIHLLQISFEDRVKKDNLLKSDPNSRVKRRLDNMPELKDYSTLKTNSILEFMSLCAIPCHIVLTAHVKEENIYEEEDDLVPKVRTMLNATPALTSNIPPLFGEVYLAQETINNNPKKGEARISYTWLTEKTNALRSVPLGTRFNVEQELVARNEPQDFRALLKKVGYFYQDKPFIKPKE